MTGRIVYARDETRYYVDGQLVTKAEYDAAFPDRLDDGPPTGNRPWTKPVASDALAVPPEQVNEYREDAVKRGVSVDFQADGRPVFTSSRQFRSYAKAYGFRHRGY